MKKEVLFIHSAGPQGPHEGSSNLVAYLHAALGDRYELKRPAMPEPENPRYEAWKEQIEKELVMRGSEVILVGHSLGGSVLLKYLSEEPCRRSIAGLFLIATPYWGKKGWQFEEYILQEDFPSKLPLIPKVFFYHSRNDEWVPFGHLGHYTKKFPQATIRGLNGSEHEFGNGLPEIVNDIRSLPGHIIMKPH
jgi:uncharacterized protein